MVEYVHTRAAHFFATEHQLFMKVTTNQRLAAALELLRSRQAPPKILRRQVTEKRIPQK